MKDTTPPHLAYRTKFTRTGERDMTNRKPSSNPVNKAVIAALGRDSDGAYRVHYRIDGKGVRGAF